MQRRTKWVVATTAVVLGLALYIYVIYALFCFVLTGGDGAFLHLSYRGVIQIDETTIGPMEAWPDGLAFHPDGRIAFSEGHGTHKDMRIVYWSQQGDFEPVVEIKYARRQRGQDDSSALEKQGFFWFFSGPLAFDADGTCYFSLGSCQPNGIYRVTSADPIDIEKLLALGSTSSLQVPLFDKTHLYSTSWNGIFRYPMTASSSKSKPWFRISGDGILMNHSLIIDPNRVVVRSLIRKPSNTQKREYDTKTLLFDKEQKAFWSLSVDDFGPMAISWDGKQMIRFDGKAKTIKEFSLQGIAEPAVVREPKFVIPEENLQIPQELQACAANFRKIYVAIKRYEKDKDKLPDWLSDLVPNYLSNETLFCPDDANHNSPFWRDPKLPCSYGYEFSMAGIPRSWSVVGGMPCRDWKTQQVKLFGDIVPVVRCHHHPTRPLNLSVGGQIYWGPGSWEKLFMPDYRRGIELSKRPSQPPAPTEVEPSRGKLDLSGTQTTDADLARRLEGLTSLQELNLQDTQISDAGLVHLKDLTSLRSLNLSRTKIATKTHKLLGQLLTDVKFTSLNGEQIDISQYKGKVVLIDFWATWCGPCIRELPNVKKTYSDYHDRGFEIIGISLDKSRTTLEKFIKNNNIPWPQYFDGKGWKNEISTRFDIHSIPATFLLDQKGIIRYANLRGLALERAVADVLRGSSLPNAQITSMGMAHLKGLTSLETLRLENTQVSDEGLSHLKGLTSLKVLYVGGTQITDTGLFHLKNLTGLQRLCAHNTQVTDVGLAYLKDLVGLEYLCFHDTQVTDASLVHLKGLTSLETLYLHNTGVSDVGVVHLRGLTSLRQLNLQGTKVSSAGLAELKQALPNCRILGIPAPKQPRRVRQCGYSTAPPDPNSNYCYPNSEFALRSPSQNDNQVGCQVRGPLLDRLQDNDYRCASLFSHQYCL